MKIIFLDIDGVLHNAKGNKIFSQSQVNNLMYIINKTGAKVVISSDWKYGLESLYNTWMESILPPYIGHTDRLYYIDKKRYSNDYTNLEKIREKEIKDFLETSNQSLDNITHWCVIDDLELSIDNFIKTDSKIGLNRKLAEDAIYILNK